MSKIIMTLLVRNEIDILETNLEFHRAQGVDFFVVTDRKSDDGTREVLERYQAQGLIHLIREDVDYFAQGPWVTRMARLACTEYDADWVINNDTDEFWWPEEGSLKTTLESVPQEFGIVSVERFNYTPRPDADGSFYENMIVREVVSRNPVGERLPPKVLHRAFPHVVVDYGNHSISGEGYGETLADGSISIFHFPMRSYRQFEQKIVTGATALELNDDVEYAIGYTWRRLYDQYERGALSNYYDEHVLTDEQVEKALAEGSHVVDSRLRDFLREHVVV